MTFSGHTTEATLSRVYKGGVSRTWVIIHCIDMSSPLGTISFNAHNIPSDSVALKSKEQRFERYGQLELMHARNRPAPMSCRLPKVSVQM